MPYGSALRGILGGGGYSAVAVNFDGGSDYLNRGGALTGVSDGTVFALSFWINPKAIASSRWVFGVNNGSRDIRAPQLLSGGALRFRFENSSGVGVLDATTSTTLSINNWYHVLISFDLSNASNRAIYIDGVLDSTSWATYNTAGTIDFTPTDWFMATDQVGGDRLQADISDFWGRFGGSYLDVTDSAVRAKFRDSNGKPVPLGGTGANPTGSSPQLVFNSPVSTWHTNKGTGGGFTENGALTKAATSPSD